MNLFTHTRHEADAAPHRIEVEEPAHEDCSPPPPPEGNVKLRNYRLLTENLRAYTPTGDIHTSPKKGKLVSKFEVFTVLSPPRSKILELLRPEDPGREALEAIVRPAPRRGLTRPLDEDTRRFLQRALLSPSPQFSQAATPEPSQKLTESEPSEEADKTHYTRPPKLQEIGREQSLADELREAEEVERSGITRDIFRELKSGGMKEAVERDRLGKLALSVEEDEDEEEDGDLCLAARRLDELLVESRALHRELAGIQEDIQVQCARAGRCAGAARALITESVALRYLDDVVALLKGDVSGAVRAKEWPFALGTRRPGRNYII